MPQFPERIVTGIGPDGKSEVALEGAPPTIVQIHNVSVAETWVSEAHQPDQSKLEDLAANDLRLAPPPGASIFRYFTLEPDDDGLDEEDRRKHAEQMFDALGGEDSTGDTSKHADMHQTDSLDYVILLRGEVTLILETEERTLKPFDVVVQRGTNHAWVNRGQETALLAAVLISTKIPG